MSYVSDIVCDLIKKYKTYDPFEMAKSLGINIIYTDLNEEISGFYRYRKRNKFIVINNNLNDNMKRFVLSHELGHGVMHPKTSTYFLKRHTLYPVGRIENEANEFAIKLLTYDIEIYEGMTKRCLLKLCGIPPEMERFL